MTEYVRVNVTSATSPPKYNIYGEKEAEVDLNLPANLVNSAEHVSRANLAVMKLFLPMAAIPHNSVRVIVPRPIIPGPTPSLPETTQVISTMRVGFATGMFNPDSGEFDFEPEPVFFRDADQMVTSQVTFIAKHSREGDGVRMAQMEMREGEHEISSISELVERVNEAIAENLADNRRDNMRDHAPRVYLDVETDNSISMKVLPRSIYSACPCSQPPLVDDERPFKFYSDRICTSDYYDVFYLVGNEDFANMFPSLPWIKTHLSLPNYPNPAYLLDTTQAKVGIQSNYVEMEEATSSLLTLHFTGSDVTTLSNISSFIVTMNGASFNQQVYPINFQANTASAAQTTTVPIVEVYYPVFQNPSDLTTDLIVIKDAFSDAAPIAINPGLLKERTIKFKVWRVLKDGRMKEVVIPASSVFCMQLCFELFPLQ